VWSSWWNVNWQEKLKYSERKPAPMPLCPPKIPHDVTRCRTKVVAVRIIVKIH
jgi:hypothetical protein